MKVEQYVPNEAVFQIKIKLSSENDEVGAISALWHLDMKGDDKYTNI